jgi:hypothetical protein
MSTRVSQQLEYCSMYSVEQFDKERWRYRYPVPVPVQYSCATPATIDSQTLLTAPLPSCRPAVLPPLLPALLSITMVPGKTV